MHRDPLICRENPDLAAKLDSYCQPQTLLILSNSQKLHELHDVCLSVSLPDLMTKS